MMIQQNPVQPMMIQQERNSAQPVMTQQNPVQAMMIQQLSSGLSDGKRECFDGWVSAWMRFVALSGAKRSEGEAQGFFFSEV